MVPVQYVYRYVVFICLLNVYPVPVPVVKASDNSIKMCNSTKTDQINCTRNSSVSQNNGKKPKKSFSLPQEILITTMVISTVGVLTNGLLIVVIVKDPLNKLRRGPWITILSLSIADFTASLSQFMIVGLGRLFEIKPSKAVIYSFLFFWMFGAAGSFFHLTSLTWQTYMIAKYPKYKQQMLSTKKIYILCATVWLISICMAFGELTSIYTKKNEQLMYTYITVYAVLEIAVLLQIILKCFILKVVLQSRQDTKVNAKQYNTKHFEIVKAIIVLNVLLLVTAFPYFVAKQVEFIQRLGKIQGELARRFSYYYEPVAMVNFAVNPIVYALRLPDYRNSTKALFKKTRIVSIQNQGIPSFHFVLVLVNLYDR
ncbi:cannabinoid receptor 1-like [Xenia sp. Carnegie-2017]|uniref:cannabinoid receptor 1-like n=1 Tax=Xenia sp. Carnegie-2017 TaxID=2897299 RepID=UPI001F040E28|nr:cannabinoid receptor 1-like [Xenia sp. Carnegie-2017]XP_046859760.1 cannabinoid receptor 1-like [Xenia sp. Carnegie-2017]XP_046859761.1 cannabinoid receptor 1-like [Xenia sp. Carnegie-2017]